MFKFSTRPPQVADETGRRFVAKTRRLVEITLPKRTWTFVTGKTTTLPRGKYWAELKFSEWHSAGELTLVISAEIYEPLKQYAAHMRKNFPKSKIGSRLRWPGRTYMLAPRSARKHSSGPYDKRVLDEGIAVLLASQPAIAERFDRIEVHQGTAVRVVFTAEHAGIGEKVGHFIADRHQRRQEELARLRRERQLGQG